MFETLLARNLSKPHGIVGHYVSRFLRENQIEYDQLEDLLDLRDGLVMLEIGYGLGYGMTAFAEGHDLRIDGIDASRLMFKKASRRNRSLIRQGRIRLYCGDFDDYQAAEQSYDRIYALNVLYFWKEPRNEIARMSRLLAPGGRLVLFMASPERISRGSMGNTAVFNKHAVRDIVEALGDQGLVNLQTVEHPDEEQCFYVIAERR